MSAYRRVGVLRNAGRRAKLAETKPETLPTPKGSFVPLRGTNSPYHETLKIELYDSNNETIPW